MGQYPRFCIKDRLSRLAREDGEQGLAGLEALPDPEPLPQEVTESRERRVALQTDIVALPPQVRAIVQLRCFRQLTFAEIGRTLHLPETTVKTSFYRALPRLRRALTSHGPWASIW